MKKNILLIITLIYFSIGKTQVLSTLLEDTITLSTFDLNEFLEEKTYIINSHADTIIVDFNVLNINQIPSGWGTIAFCFTSFPAVAGNNDVCLDLSTSGSVAGEHKIAPGDSIELKIQVDGGGVAGKVILNIELFVEDKTFTDSETQNLYIDLDLKSDNVNVRSLNNSSFQIYPNPVKDFLFFSDFENLNFKGAKVEIYSIIGLKAYESSFTQNSIDVSKLQDGVYMIKILNEKGQQVLTKTFVKK